MSQAKSLLALSLAGLLSATGCATAHLRGQYAPQSLPKNKEITHSGEKQTLASGHDWILFWGLLIYLPDVPGPITVALIAAVGVASGAVMINFAFAKESVPLALGGTVSGITNMGMMLGGMVMQPVVGLVLDRNWGGLLVDGARVYDAAAYRAGFSAMLAWTVVALILLAFMKETCCRAQR